MTSPTAEDFRATGYTAAAINFPLSERAFLWLCRWNNIAPTKAPATWRYAPNAAVQALLDRKAETAE